MICLSHNGYNNCAEWSQQFLNQCHKVSSFVAFMCWSLWRARNELYFEQKYSSPIDVIWRAEKGFREYVEIEAPVPDEVPSPMARTPVRASTWSPSAPGFFTLSADATFCLAKQRSGIGYVVRDHLGQPLLAVSEVSFFHSSVVGEAFALQSGIAAALSAGYSSLKVESDNLEVINLVNGVQKDCNVYLKFVCSGYTFL
ncbi:hypothetical protein NE237_021468 [Protea cynaroides]|uniref:RNase H type-1 domain-containing protein n=1 Tax=Protea cynaroides TaxID=273540 RepID=A0A9Q0H8L3_9MAGN|nr:hypothetical protein NE237_021468 [Protea cynaroides]